MEIITTVPIPLSLNDDLVNEEQDVMDELEPLDPEDPPDNVITLF